jgi:hypothetical protein
MKQIYIVYTKNGYIPENEVTIAERAFVSKPRAEAFKIKLSRKHSMGLTHYIKPTYLDEKE